jgi:glycosyltransferase involved in cell wall biosynthesis
MDGGSTDETLSILKRYPHLKWASEPDRGQSHAINKGFQRAKGEIAAWLNSDDTYLPGAVTAAVEALDKSKGRYIVMGQCPFIDEEGNPTGVYHPSSYRTRRDLIKIWKGLYSIPQPTVFFFKELLDQFGGLDESLYVAMDYELWLRFTKKYRFTTINKPLATYRLHGKSKTMETTDQELSQKTAEISRRYWGSKVSPSYWYYHFSFRLSQIFLWKISSVYWNRSVEYYNGKKWARAAFYLFIALSLYPPAIFRKKHVFSHLVKTYISKRIGSHLDRLVLHPDPSKCDGKVHNDGWVSDYATLPLVIPPSTRRVEIVGEVHLNFFDNTPLCIKVFLNGSLIEERVLTQSGEFRIDIDLGGYPRASQNEISLYPDKIFIPEVLGEGPDKRRLSFIYKNAILSQG